MFGICILSIVPVRKEPSDASEMVTQLLFGDTFRILETTKKWIRIQITFDQYEGWIDRKQFQEISVNDFQALQNSEAIYNAEYIDFVSNTNHTTIPIPIGAEVGWLQMPNLNTKDWNFDGNKIVGINNKSQLVKIAMQYLNAPYLWGGKTPFGIDCSGFTQMVYKINGYSLLRDASQQANQGEALSFIEESEPGDLAFFDNEEGKIIHVGILLQDNYIIHASGQVRIDRLDHLGIFNQENNRHTHRLRVIKKLI
ncbi:MAG: NlpC/P60 family protein [Flavobacterium sp.]